jgi:hypothetical protein
VQHLGDFAEDATVELFFNTTDKTNSAPITLAGTPAVSVYKSGSTTEITAGVTLNVDYDSRTGMHRVVVDMSASASYTPGAEYKAVITTGTVDSTSVVGTEIGSWSCENRFQEVDVVKVAGAAAANNAGKFEVDLSHVDGVAVDVNSAQLGVKLVSTANDAITNNSLAAGAISEPKIAANALPAAKFPSSFSDLVETAMSLVVEAYDLDHLLKVAMPLGLPVEDSWAWTVDQAIGNVPTNAELATALGTSDDAVLAAIALLPTAAAVADLPTNAELAAALAAADDAVLAAIAARPSANAIADAVLSRSVTNVQDTAAVGSLAELILATFHAAIVDAVLTIRKTGGSTFNTRPVTEDADAVPISGVG